MASATANDIRTEAAVGMGQVGLARAPQRLKSVLGSCVGVALYHAETRAGVLAHVVLPDSSGRKDVPGKFADTAIPHMLALLEKAGAGRRGLVAKIAGGANMFGHNGPLQIGDANVLAVSQALEKLGIRLVAKDVGGTAGRRATLDCSTGNFVVEIMGKAPRIL